VLTVPVVWLVVSLVFLLIHLVPGDPIVQMLGEDASLAAILTRMVRTAMLEELGQDYIRSRQGPQ
jgi:peptide/nickel transport system permease protein